LGSNTAKPMDRHHSSPRNLHVDRVNSEKRPHSGRNTGVPRRLADNHEHLGLFDGVVYDGVEHRDRRRVQAVQRDNIILPFTLGYLP